MSTIKEKDLIEDHIVKLYLCAKETVKKPKFVSEIIEQMLRLEKLMDYHHLNPDASPRIDCLISYEFQKI